MTKNIRLYLEGLAPLVVISMVCYMYKDDLELLNIAMLYLLPILFTATRYGRVPTFFVSLCAALLFDILFVPPVLHLTVHDMEYLFSFIIMITVGQLVSALATKAAKTKELEAGEKLYEAVLGSLSHELRTPLAVVIGATSSLLSKELKLSDAERIELCESAFLSAKSMQELIENLLASARFESGGVKPTFSICSIDEVVGSALLRVEKKYSKEAVFKIADDLPSLNTDALLLEQAFYNILDNAFKYGNNVKVEIESSMNDLIVKVCNDGNIPRDHELSFAGEKFCRLSNSIGIQGTGLGLFLTKRTVEALGGECEIYIKDGYFCISIELR